jgi:hypothetical protein
MERLQRYVSNELTHFVGRSCKDDESRYDQFKAILSSCRLEPRPVGFLRSPGGISMGMSASASLSSNEVYETEVVCFCDIPVEDFDLHMQKYSHFGLSFLKQFLVGKEANPVFYIARDATDRYPSIHGRRLGKPMIDRGESFDAFFLAYREGFNRLFPWVSMNGPGRKDVPAELLKVLEELMMLKSFLNDLFSYFKFFDTKESEASTRNFYMEREWRTRGVLEFSLDDVHRVIFPAAYARRFRRDFPDFFGQITFSN